MKCARNSNLSTIEKNAQGNCIDREAPMYTTGLHIILKLNETVKELGFYSFKYFC